MYYAVHPTEGYVMLAGPLEMILKILADRDYILMAAAN